MIFFQQFHLDREGDLTVDLYLDGERMLYVIRTPNHHTGNLIRNLARLCELETDEDDGGLLVIRGEVPCYFDGGNRRMYILRLGNTKVANIYPDGTVELKASVPAISKTLMSQTKDYRLGIEKTIVKTYIRSECKFRTDLHTHMNGNLPPDVLIALGLVHQIRYPYYYIKKLGLEITGEQRERLERRRAEAERELGEIPLTGRHRERRIDDHTFINFAELILGNAAHAEENIKLIRNSLTVPKDGQAVFADLEKVYLYRYVFTRGVRSDEPISGISPERIPDRAVSELAARALCDREDDRYRGNTLYQDLLLWIAREYRSHGIEYAEITDTALLNRAEAPARLREIHEIMPAVTRETGVLLRFLAGIRRVPLTIVRDRVTPSGYLADNMRCLRAIAEDPYVAGGDVVGEETNDILELRGTIRELVKLAGENEGFVIRIHAGENDSLRDNVANSIRCVAEALGEDQSFPPLRIGHGLYTCDLGSPKGRKLLEDIRANGVTLEFQLSSNVRLNNLSKLDRHPLRRYLRAGVRCVQGTDGGALYGTNSIDEELSLEKLLGLSFEELCSMRAAEDELLRSARRDFEEKTARFRESFSGGDVELYYRAALERAQSVPQDLWQDRGREDSAEALLTQLDALPKEGLALVVAGGSFNASRRRGAMRDGDRAFIDELLERADPEECFFVVGHTLSAQEGYLVRRAAGRFRVYAIVPGRLTHAELSRLRRSGAGVILSPALSAAGLYTSFGEEIFSRRASALLAFDGNSPALNLIQEARNARRSCRIYFDSRSRALSEKAKTLQGYVRELPSAERLAAELGVERRGE